MKIGFLITARLKSKRLPLKLLLPLGEKTIIEQVISRVQSINPAIEPIVLCTSTNSQDDALEDIAKCSGIYCFRGSEDDVFERLTSAAMLFQLDSFLSITGENPFFSRTMANEVLSQLQSGRYDYVKVVGLPRGCAVSGINTATAQLICNNKVWDDTEMWRPLIDQPDIFKVKELAFVNPFGLPADLRLTIDYPEDYKLFQMLYNQLSDNVNRISLFQIFKFLEDNPEYLEINKMCKQEEVSSIREKVIRLFYSRSGFKR